LSGQKPIIEALSPSVGLPGDTLLITGRNFGAERDRSSVSIAGSLPTSGNYEEWTDTHISLQIPEGTKSGLVYVQTQSGRSRGVLFTNKTQVPEILEGPSAPGMPFIADFGPASGSVGSIVTFSGTNFGLDRDEARVYFTWDAGERPANLESSDFSRVIPATDLDFDYIGWTDREVRVKVPDGAASGNVFIVTARGRSNSVYFEVEEPVGFKVLRRRRTYSLESRVDIGGIVSAAGDNNLYIWLPRVSEGFQQREIQIIERSRDPLFENIKGLSLYQFSNLTGGERHSIKINLFFDRYAVETQITSSRSIPGYERENDFYRYYTSADFLIPSEEPLVTDIARNAVGREKNPYNIAARIYRRVITVLEPESGPLMVPAQTGLETGVGGPFTYAVLMTAMFRTSGIPARIVSGYLVDGTFKTIRHYWGEFYIQSLGWVPADPFLGEGSEEDQEYYFGSLDNTHFSVSRGIADIAPITPYGNKMYFENAGIDKLYSLQNIYEESTGDLSSYVTTWYDMDVIGIY
jgi:transglutaminase-like putative cysteine protease